MVHTNYLFTPLALACALSITEMVTISASQSSLDEVLLEELDAFSEYISKAPNLPEPEKPNAYSFGSLCRLIGKSLDPVPFCTETHTENIALNILTIAHKYDLTDPSRLMPAIERVERFHRKTELVFPLIINKLPRGLASRSLKRILATHRKTIPPLLEHLVGKFLNDTAVARLQRLTPLLGTSELMKNPLLQSVVSSNHEQIEPIPVEQSTSSWVEGRFKDWADAVRASKSKRLLGHYKWFKNSIETSNLSDPTILQYLLKQAKFFEDKFQTTTHALLSLLRQPNAQLDDIAAVATINQQALSPLVYLLAMKFFCDRAAKEIERSHLTERSSTSIPPQLLERLTSFREEIKTNIVSLQRSIFLAMKKAEDAGLSHHRKTSELSSSPPHKTSIASEPIPITPQTTPPTHLQRQQSTPILKS